MLYPLSYGGDNADATNERAGPRYRPESLLPGGRAQSRAAGRAIVGGFGDGEKGRPVPPADSTSAPAKRAMSLRRGCERIGWVLDRSRRR